MDTDTNRSLSAWRSASIQAATPYPGLFDRTIDQMRVVGYPGPIFPAIHISALICMTASVVVSVSLIIFRCCSCRETRDRWRSKLNKSRVSTVNISVETAAVATVKAEPERGSNVREFRKFENWSISERLVIYLAFADTFVGLAHILDHAYILFAERSPPDPVCVTFAFLLQQFILSQWIVVLFTAVRASSLVVFGKKLSPRQERLGVDRLCDRIANDHRTGWCHFRYSWTERSMVGLTE